MKIIVFSDNHGDTDSIDKILKYYPTNDGVFCLGDSMLQDWELDNRHIIAVKGNAYLEPDVPYYFVRDIGKYKAFFTHGHLYNVKNSISSLYVNAKNNNCNICFYGHTHIVNVSEYNNILFINPGSSYLPWEPNYPTFAVVYIDDRIKVEIRTVEENRLVKTYSVKEEY